MPDQQYSLTLASNATPGSMRKRENGVLKAMKKAMRFIMNCLIYIWEFLTFTRRTPTLKEQRTIYINQEPDAAEIVKPRPLLSKILPYFSGGKDSTQSHHQLPRYPSNAVYTTKYNLITFLPKNLFEQFRRLANFYFLAMVVVQSLPQFQQTSPFFSALPITFIVLVTAAKDAFEDWRRRVSDSEMNNNTCYILDNVRNHNILHDRWSHLKMRFNEHKARWMQKLRKQDDKDGAPSVHSLIHDGEESVKEGGPYWRQSTWKNVRVGDFVKLSNNQSIPADILVLSTSESDGVCYIETKNLDGETNLKLRSALQETQHIDSAADCSRFECKIVAEPAHVNLYSLEAALTVKLSEEETKVYPLTIKETLLRGCTLRNTKWVIGIVMYTGSECKVILNAGKTPSKRSRVEKLMNLQVLLNLLLLVILCVLIALIHGIVSADDINDGTALDRPPQDLVRSSLAVFVVSLIMLQNFVPISLYVTSEIVKVAQAYFIWQDLDMYYEELDLPCVPKTWTISDDLGQIEYIFSDKTGTLTRNVMEFRQCSINGVVYGGCQEDEVEEEVAQPLPSSRQRLSKQESIAMSEQSMIRDLENFYNNPYADDKVTFVDPNFVRDLHYGSPDDQQQKEKIKEFFMHLALCHTVLSEQSKDEDDKPHILYKAQSPDEAALVATAKNVGFTFLERSGDDLIIDALGQKIRVTVLEYLEFNSARKRMSVIVRHQDGKIVLYCKGADNVIMQRCKSGQDDMKQIVGDHLEQFAAEGLRTLCLAKKDIDEQFFKEWYVRYQEAASSLDNRDDQMDDVAEQIETDMELIGATAIEDQLQEGVPECIQFLKRGGIKVWVLTGDKMETAINIGYSCSLLSQGMQLIIIKADNEQQAAYQLKIVLEKCFQLDVKQLLQHQFQQGLLDEDYYHSLQHHNHSVDMNDVLPEMDSRNDEDDVNDAFGVNGPQKYAIIIDGDALKFMNDMLVSRLFLELSARTTAVICCRVSPKQKAQVVDLVKKNRRAMTLAIGDGANDVSMIQKANVGVGINGKEGMQAVMASDYAVGQFRYLSKLLLVHGRWSYFRIAEMALQMFYKNMVWTVVLFWYQIYCGWTGTILYDFFLILFYNLFYTGLPPIIIGAFDRDINDRLSMLVPEVYVHGIKQKLYTYKQFILYIIDGIYQSLVCFYIAFLAAGNGSIVYDGYVADKAVLGTLASTCAVLVANLYMGFDNLAWTWLSFFSYGIGILIYFLMAIIVSFIKGSSLYGLGFQLFGSPVFYLSVILSVVICMLPRYLYKYSQVLISPSDIDILREIIKYNLVAERNKIHGDREDDLIKKYVPSNMASREDMSQALGSGQVMEMQPIPPRNLSMGHRTSSLQRLNEEIRNKVVRPLKKSLRDLRAKSLLVIGGNASEPNRGFAFSQEPGMALRIQRVQSRSDNMSERNASSSLRKQSTGASIGQQISPLTPLGPISPQSPVIPSRHDSLKESTVRTFLSQQDDHDTDNTSGKASSLQ
ncbi:hypothetical protein MP228_005289 [Amoeboaphelidium protococcarum]|nr:hypothetical protein MP228_005289 [Amoeboaphelidium protococcarum]